MNKSRVFSLQMMLAGLFLVGIVGCGRVVRHHHIPDKMNYARVPEDTAAHDDYEKTVEEDWEKEPIFRDVEYDGNIKDKKGAMDDYNKFVRGEHLE